MRTCVSFVLASLALAASPPGCAVDRIGTPSQQTAPALELPAAASQGSLVAGVARPGARVRYGSRVVRVADDGRFVIGIGRDAAGSVEVEATSADGDRATATIRVLPRDWPVEQVRGVPPATVNPPPAIAERIRREQQRVAAARTRDDARMDWTQHFVWPVQGRISGRFGNQRVYNGSPRAAHSGMDIAAPRGTPVRAPAAGIVTFADRDLYLTGGTLVLDHGHGVSSNFLHLSRIEVAAGQHVEQGQVIAAVGATGRASGPHLHWGMNWFDVRIDPLLVVDPR